MSLGWPSRTKSVLFVTALAALGWIALDRFVSVRPRTDPPVAASPVPFRSSPPAPAGDPPSPSGPPAHTVSAPSLTRPSRDNASPFTHAKVLAESKPQPAGKDTWRIVRILDAGRRYPVRVEELWRTDHASGQLALVSERAMAADRVLIKSADLAALRASLPHTSTTGLSLAVRPISPQSDWYPVTLADFTDPLALDRALATFSRQNAAAEPDYLVNLLSLPPNDPYFGAEYHLSAAPDSGSINALAGWVIRHDSPDVVIAVIDSGIQTDHEDLSANIWTNSAEIPGNGIDDDQNGYVDDTHGYDFTRRSASPTPSMWHGTAVAGVIAAVGDNALGVAGVTWHARLMPITIFDQDGSGLISDSAAAIDYAVANGARIINASYGGYVKTGVEEDAIVRARDAGVVIVAAAGNAGYDTDVTPCYPASYPYANILSVAASDGNASGIENWSNRGANSVDLAAPGVGIWSTFFNTQDPTATDYYAYGLAGTSFAAPQVSGALALVMAQYPAEPWYAATQRILAGVRVHEPYRGLTATGGLLDLEGALHDHTLTLPNDLPASATPLATANGSLTDLCHYATHDATEPALPSGFQGRTLWYKWTAPAPGLAHWWINGFATTARLAIYAESPSPASAPVATAGPAPAEIQLPCQPGDTFWIMTEADGIDGEFQLHWQTRPTNDTFTNALTLGSAPISIHGSDRDASREPGEPVTSPGGTGLTVWYQYSPAESGDFVFDTAGSAIDTVLSVYTGPDLAHLVLLGTSDDISFTDRSSAVRFAATAGTSVFIRVDSATPGGGDFSLHGSYVSAPVILSEPADLAVPAGTPIRLSAIVNAPAGTTYQWFSGDRPITGATSTSLFFPLASDSLAGGYHLEIHAPGSTLVSRTATVTITPAGLTIDLQPENAWIAPGHPAELTASASGPGPLTYQWDKDGQPVPDANAASLAIAANAAAAGFYQLHVANSVAEISTHIVRVQWAADATLVVDKPIGTVSASPVSQVNGFYRAGNLISPDGITWTSLPVNLQAFGHGLWVGVDGHAHSFVGPTLDSVQTHDQTSDFTATQIVFGNDRFLAYYPGSAPFLSTDGVNWSRVDTNIAAETIVFVGGHFVASGSHGTYQSTDGQNWSGNPTLVGTDLTACGDRAFLHSGNTLWTTTDGTDWTPTNAVDAHLGNVAFDGTHYLLDLVSATSPLKPTGHLVSTDGLDWTSIDLYAGGLLLGSGDGWFWVQSQTGTGALLNRFTLDAGTELTAHVPYPIFDKIYFSDGWFVGTQAGLPDCVSSDGAHWLQPSDVTTRGVRFGNRFYATDHTLPSRFISTPRRSTYPAGLTYAAVGNDTLVGHDGSGTWTIVDSGGHTQQGSIPAFAGAAGLTFTGSLFYTNANGFYWASTDGYTWKSTATSIVLSPLHFGDRYYAGGDAGTLISSSDGFVWSTDSSWSSTQTINGLFDHLGQLWVNSGAFIYQRTTDGTFKQLTDFSVADSGDGVAVGNGRMITNHGTRIGLPTGTPPEVHLLAPGYQTNFDQGETVTISAEITAPDADLDHVDVLVDGETVHTSTTAPWNWTWSPTAPGWHVVEIRAYDHQGFLGLDGGEFHVDGDRLVAQSLSLSPSINTLTTFKGRILAGGCELSPEGRWRPVNGNTSVTLSRVVASDDCLLALSSATLLRSIDGDHWQRISPVLGGTAANLSAIDGVFFTLDNSSANCTDVSLDGSNWLTIDQRFVRILHSAGLWLASDDTNHVWTSTDALIWHRQPRAPTMPSTTLQSVSRGFVGFVGGQPYFSTDGSLWTATSFPITATAVPGTWSAGGLVFARVTSAASGEFMLATSDGVSWATTGLSSPGSSAFEILFKNNHWFSKIIGRYSESPDGYSWGPTYNPGNNSTALVELGNRAALVTSSGVYAWHNDDGTWTRTSTTTNTGLTAGAIVDHPTRPLLLSQTDTYGTRPDGTNYLLDPTAGSISSGVWDGNRFVLFGYGYGTFDYATDTGIVWRQSSSESFFQAVLAQGRPVALSVNGVIGVVGTDGNLVLRPSPTFINDGGFEETVVFKSLGTDGQNLYAPSPTGLYKSTDLGLTWAKIIDAPYVYASNGVLAPACLGGHLVFQQGNGSLGVANLDGSFVAATDQWADSLVVSSLGFTLLTTDDRILTSADGVSWTQFGDTVPGANSLATYRGLPATVGAVFSLVLDSDLALTALSHPTGEYALGDDIPLTVTLSNHGHSDIVLPAAGAWLGWLSPAGNLWDTSTANNSELPISNTPSATLAPGQTATYTVDLRIPADLPAGNYTVGLSIGYDQAFTHEISAANNRLSAAADSVHIPSWPVSVAIQGAGRVQTTSDLQNVPSGQSVTLVPLPARGYEFTGWLGDVSNPPDILSVTVTRPLSLTAVFSPARVGIAIGRSGGGAVSGLPTDAVVAPDVMLHLQATPDSGWFFAGWNRDSLPRAAQLDITAGDAVGLEAWFAPTFEGWRADRFDAAQLSDDSVSAPAADPDHDGIPNLLEYALGTDPLTPSAPPALNPLHDGTDFVLELQRSLQARSLDLELLSGDSPASDTSIPVEVETISADASAETIRIRPITTPSGDRRFFRLRLTLP